MDDVGTTARNDPARDGARGGRSRRGAAVGVVLVAALAVELCADLWPGSTPRETVARWWDGSSVAEAGAFDPYGPGLARQAGGGDVALSFAPFPNDTAWNAADLYFHLCYDLYPARARVADPGTIINSGVQLSRAATRPAAGAGAATLIVRAVPSGEGGIKVFSRRAVPRPAGDGGAPPGGAGR